MKFLASIVERVINFASSRETQVRISVHLASLTDYDRIFWEKNVERENSFRCTDGQFPYLVERQTKRVVLFIEHLSIQSLILRGDFLENLLQAVERQQKRQKRFDQELDNTMKRYKDFLPLIECK